MSRYHPKKRLGQNFLESESVICQIVEAIAPGPNDQIIEVGPGTGTLTKKLADSKAKIKAIEFDRDLIDHLYRNLSGCGNVEIINADFLSYDPDWVSFKLVGNLPFNITSPAIDWTIRHRSRIKSAVFMVQKEVAKRLASLPGSKDWSPLAIFTQLHFHVEICFDVSPQSFNPPPKVTSAVIRLTPVESVEVTNPELFERIVRASFRQRRKLLSNNLVPDIISDRDALNKLLAKLDLADKCRAEEISIAQFLKLTEAIETYNISS